jgi:uncharacterized protein (DUF1330 family)
MVGRWIGSNWGRKAMKTRSAAVLSLLAGLAIGAAAIQGLHAAARPPAYVVTEVGIGDLDAYLKEYLPVAEASIQASGGRLIAGGQNILVLEGPARGTRVAISRFDSLDAVQAWRGSDRYREARKIADKYARFRSFAIEGLPQ